MRRAVQRDLMPRRRNVRHKGQIFFVGVLRADKEGGRDLLLIENFQNWPGVFAGAVVKGQADDFGQRIFPSRSGHRKAVVGGVGLGVLPVVQQMDDAGQHHQHSRQHHARQQSCVSFLSVCIPPHGKPLPCCGLVQGMRARREIDTQRRGVV